MGSKKVAAADVARAACQIVHSEPAKESTLSSVVYDRRSTGVFPAFVKAQTNLGDAVDQMNAAEFWGVREMKDCVLTLCRPDQD